MKPFDTYQHLEGTPLTPRDETEVGSRFWNKGKWDNFVAPFLPKDCSGLTLVDIGCNAGVFLNLAEERGFSRIIGVESNKNAVLKGVAWRDQHKKHYKFIQMKMEDCLDALPMADYTILANVHYYFKIEDWLRYLDRLQHKTAHCIVVTDTAKRPGNRCWTQADIMSINRYFREWSFAGRSPSGLADGDPRPRALVGLHFESNSIRKVPIDSLDCGNHVQDGFYKELDEGKHYSDTRYYRIIRKYRLEDRKDWSEKELEEFFKKRVALYMDVVANGQKEPLLADPDEKILDGNHKCHIQEHLGNNKVFVRYV